MPSGSCIAARRASSASGRRSPSVSVVRRASGAVGCWWSDAPVPARPKPRRVAFRLQDVPDVRVLFCRCRPNPPRPRTGRQGRQVLPHRPGQNPSAPCQLRLRSRYSAASWNVEPYRSAQAPLGRLSVHQFTASCRSGSRNRAASPRRHRPAASARRWLHCLGTPLPRRPSHGALATGE